MDARPNLSAPARRTIDLRRIEVIDADSARCLAALGFAGRLAGLDRLVESAVLLVRAHVERQHATWTPDQVRAEVARRVSGAAT